MAQPRLNPQRQQLALQYFLRVINSRASLSDTKREALAAWAQGYFKVGADTEVTKPADKGGRPRLFDHAMSAAERMRRFRHAKRAKA